MGKVTVNLDTKKVRGKGVSKVMKVFSNDPVNPEFSLTLKGTILEILETRPLQIKLQGLAGKPLEGTFGFNAGSPLDVEIVDVRTAGKGWITAAEPVVIEEGRSFELSLSASANSKPAVLREKLILDVKTSDGQDRSLEFNVQLDHRDRIVLQPKNNIKFMDKETRNLLNAGSKPIEKSILVTGGDPEVSFEVTEVNLDDRIQGAFTTRIQEVVAGKSYRVWITLSEYQSTPTVLGKMTIKTSDEIKKEISMWVMGQFPQKRQTAP